MSIKLDFILKRNKTSLITFIQKNKLTNYQRLLEYCKMRKFIPCTEEEYNEVSNIEREPTKKLARKASKSQKKRKTRSSSKRK